MIGCNGQRRPKSDIPWQREGQRDSRRHKPRNPCPANRTTPASASWIAEQIEAHAPEKTEDAESALQLAEACAAFAGASVTAFGLSLPADFPKRDELRAQAIAALKRWLPRLDPERTARLKKMLAEYRLGAS